MSTRASSVGPAATVDVSTPRALLITEWVASLATAGILGMAAFAKFFNYTPEGSMALAQGLGVGRGVVTLIGAVELGALLLILAPRTRALGGVLAVLTMLGALFSHATRLGFSGSAAAEMWPLALVTLVTASLVTWLRRDDLARLLSR